MEITKSQHLLANVRAVYEAKACLEKFRTQV